MYIYILYTLKRKLYRNIIYYLFDDIFDVKCTDFVLQNVIKIKVYMP